MLNLRAARKAHDAVAAAGAVGFGAVPGMDKVRRPARHGAATAAEMVMAAAGAGARPLTPQKRDGGIEGGFLQKKFRC